MTRVTDEAPAVKESPAEVRLSPADGEVGKWSMAWIFASVVLILLATVPGWWRKLGIALIALVIVFFYGWLTRGALPMKTIVIALLCASLAACDKLGVSGPMNRIVGNWAEVNLPPGCVAKQIAADERGGVAVLCEDGRVFH